MRIPSIHTDSNSFKAQLKKVFNHSLLVKEDDKGNYILKRKDLDSLAIEIMTACKVYSLSHRNIIIKSDEQLDKKLKKTMASSEKSARLFCNLLHLMKTKLKHNLPKKIEIDSPDWLTIKSIIPLANEFCETFGFTQEEGFKKYLILLLGRMNNKFILNRASYLHSNVCFDYEAHVIITSDNYPDITQKTHNEYNDQVFRKTGINTNYLKNIQKYQYFVKAAERIKSLGIEPAIYIEAQFEGLSWANGIPNPEQLIGDTAEMRLVKYMAENQITITQAPKAKIDWNKIKQKNDTD